MAVLSVLPVAITHAQKDTKSLLVAWFGFLCSVMGPFPCRAPHNRIHTAALSQMVSHELCQNGAKQTHPSLLKSFIDERRRSHHRPYVPCYTPQLPGLSTWHVKHWSLPWTSRTEALISFLAVLHTTGCCKLNYSSSEVCKILLCSGYILLWINNLGRRLYRRTWIVWLW